MRTFPLNLAAFVTAAVLVIAVSFGLLQTGDLGDGGSGDAVANPTLTPAALEATASPAPSEPLETGSAPGGSFY